MNVLIDNSTYFSFKAAVQHRILDPHIIYNMANFIECLVVADEVRLAPTTLWRPTANDQVDRELFAPGGPCRTVDRLAQDEESTARLLDDALEESTKDIRRTDIALPFCKAGVNLVKTKNILESWRLSASRSPLSFMDTYSGFVFLTDIGTARTFRDEMHGSRESIPPEHHLANYLLRCNVALQLSDQLPYHPHSHRVPLVGLKMERTAKRSALDLARLIRFTEASIEHNLARTLTEAYRDFCGPLETSDAQLPLVLAVVLSGADSPDKIVKCALKLRNSKAAKRYRKWIGQLWQSSRDGQPLITRHAAAAELSDARTLLSDYLAGLYGPKMQDVPTRDSTLISVVDPIDLDVAEWQDAAIEGAKAAARGASSVLGWLRRRPLRRKAALLMNMSRQAGRAGTLSALLKRTFGKGLTGAEVQSLAALRQGRAGFIAQLIGASGPDGGTP